MDVLSAAHRLADETRFKWLSCFNTMPSLEKGAGYSFRRATLKGKCTRPLLLTGSVRGTWSPQRDTISQVLVAAQKNT